MVKSKTENIIPWFKNVVPHNDIKEGHLDESIFAANLADVAMNKAKEIYQNPNTFFQKTFFTSGIKVIAKRVIAGLNGKQDAENRVMSLQTGFGGGKTHTLISLYHLAKLGDEAETSNYTKELIEYTGKPNFKSANIAIFTNTTNDPTHGRKVNGLHLKTLWGELAYQLGGKKVYEIIKANDEKQISPKGLFKQILEQTKPALILIDEVADYCVAASGIKVGSTSLSDQTISFMQELSEAISSVDNCVLVATLPASVAEVANSQKSAEILTSLSNRLGRVGADTKPVADEEIFEVIQRRLFEDLGEKKVIENVLSEFMTMHEQLWTELPSQANKSEYKEKLRKSYPFHPELIDIFRIRWASNHDFQRTRGVLRLLASITADLWNRQQSLTGSNLLIHTSDVNFQNLDALSGQLKKLYGNGYDAVIQADVSGTSSNAFKIDQEKKSFGQYNLTQGLSATILLGSFGSTGANKGMSIKELKLCLLKPHLFNHNDINGVLDSLESHAHYLHYSSIGTDTRRYWYHTKPNINILINQAKNDIIESDIHAEILKRINAKKDNVTVFNVLVDPSNQIPEQLKPTMIILHPRNICDPGNLKANVKTLIESIATKKGGNERIYRNTILFLCCTEVGASGLLGNLKDYLSCVKIREEYQSQLEADQKDDLRKKVEEYSKQVNTAIVTAYSLIIKYSAKNGFQTIPVRQFKDSIDIQINTNIFQLLKNEEWVL